MCQIHNTKITCVELYQCNIIYPDSKFCGAGLSPSLIFGSSVAISTVLNNLIILPLVQVCVSLYRIGSLVLILTEAA